MLVMNPGAVGIAVVICVTEQILVLVRHLFCSSKVLWGFLVFCGIFFSFPDKCKFSLGLDLLP